MRKSRCTLYKDIKSIERKIESIKLNKLKQIVPLNP